MSENGYGQIVSHRTCATFDEAREIAVAEAARDYVG